MCNQTVTCTYTDDDGDEVELVLPARWGVCDDCDGQGTTLRESLRGAFTQSEFEEVFDDEESQAEYFRHGGIYDVQCKTCHGRTTVLVPDMDHSSVTDAMRASFEAYQTDREESARYDREDRATRRAESGYRD